MKHLKTTLLSVALTSLFIGCSPSLGYNQWKSAKIYQGNGQIWLAMDAYKNAIQVEPELMLDSTFMTDYHSTHILYNLTEAKRHLSAGRGRSASALLTQAHQFGEPFANVEVELLQAYDLACLESLRDAREAAYEGDLERCQLYLDEAASWQAENTTYTHVITLWRQVPATTTEAEALYGNKHLRQALSVCQENIATDNWDLRSILLAYKIQAHMTLSYEKCRQANDLWIQENIRASHHVYAQVAQEWPACDMLEPNFTTTRARLQQYNQNTSDAAEYLQSAKPLKALSAAINAYQAAPLEAHPHLKPALISASNYYEKEGFLGISLTVLCGLPKPLWNNDWQQLVSHQYTKSCAAVVPAWRILVQQDALNPVASLLRKRLPPAGNGDALVYSLTGTLEIDKERTRTSNHTHRWIVNREVPNANYYALYRELNRNENQLRNLNRSLSHERRRSWNRHYDFTCPYSYDCNDSWYSLNYMNQYRNSCSSYNTIHRLERERSRTRQDIRNLQNRLYNTPETRIASEQHQHQYTIENWQINSSGNARLSLDGTSIAHAENHGNWSDATIINPLPSEGLEDPLLLPSLSDIKNDYMQRFANILEVELRAQLTEHIRTNIEALPNTTDREQLNVNAMRTIVQSSPANPQQAYFALYQIFTQQELEVILS